MSFLIQKNPYIRSQIVPAVVDYDAFFEALLQYFNKQFQIQIHKDENLEIEVKLGSFFSRDLKFQQIFQEIQFVSSLNHIIINDYSKNYIFQPNFFVGEYPYFYADNPPSFTRLNRYVKQLSKKKIQQYKTINNLYVGDDTMQNIFHDLRLDINFQKGDRASIYLLTDKIDLISKERGESLDIMKNIIQFRITTQTEKNYQGKQEDIDKRIREGEQIRSVRFKSQSRFRFQFIQIDLSRVLNLENFEFPQTLNWKQILLDLFYKLHDIDGSIGGDKQQQIYLSKRKVEIEFEIIDLKFMRDYLEPSIKRLIRNVDSFFYVEKVENEVIQNQIREKNPQFKKYQAPVIGNYLQKIMSL